MIFSNKENFEIEQYVFYAGGIGDMWRVAGDKVYIKVGFWMPDAIPETVQGDQGAFAEIKKNRQEAYKNLTFDRYLELLKTGSAIEISEKDGFLVLQFKPDNLNHLPTFLPGLNFDKEQVRISKNEISLWIYKKDNTLRLARARIEGNYNDGKPFIKECEHYFTNFNLPFTLGEPKNIYQQ